MNTKEQNSKKDLKENKDIMQEKEICDDVDSKDIESSEEKNTSSDKAQCKEAEVVSDQEEKQVSDQEEKVGSEQKENEDKTKVADKDMKFGKKKGQDELGEKLLELQDKYVRLSAEFDNYRKRMLKERMDLIKNAGENILVNVLPVMDNFERALASIEKTDDVVAVKDGISLIYKGFQDFLKQNGIKEIECIEKDFNTDEQEAITKIPAPKEELKGKVVDCVQKGYFLNDKVIRFAKVVVGE